MKDIKLREAEDKDVKTVDRAADLAERMKKALVRTAQIKRRT